MIITRRHVEGAVRSTIIYGGLTFYGIERPWLDNKPFESCIPAGMYTAFPHVSPRHGECLALIGGSVALEQTEGIRRFACLMHVANYAHQVQGCIGVGLDEARHPEHGAMVTNSRAAMGQLLQAVTKPTHVQIRWSA